MNNDQLLTQQETADILRRSTISIWRLRRDGKLAFVRVGNRCLFRRADIDAFVQRQVRNRHAAADASA